MRKSHFVVLLTFFNLQYSSFSLISTDEHESPMSYKTCFREPSNNDKYINMFLSSRSKWNSLGVKHEDLSKSEEHHPQTLLTQVMGIPHRKKHLKKNNPLGDKIPWVEGWCVIICLPSDSDMPGMPRLVPSLRQHASQCPHMWGPYLSKPPQQQFHKRSEGIIK